MTTRSVEQYESAVRFQRAALVILAEAAEQECGDEPGAVAQSAPQVAVCATRALLTVELGSDDDAEAFGPLAATLLGHVLGRVPPGTPAPKPAAALPRGWGRG